MCSGRAGTFRRGHRLVASSAVARQAAGVFVGRFRLVLTAEQTLDPFTQLAQVEAGGATSERVPFAEFVATIRVALMYEKVRQTAQMSLLL